MLSGKQKGMKPNEYRLEHRGPSGDGEYEVTATLPAPEYRSMQPSAMKTEVIICRLKDRDATGFAEKA